jgi:hypothetical protein
MYWAEFSLDTDKERFEEIKGIKSGYYETKYHGVEAGNG